MRCPPNTNHDSRSNARFDCARDRGCIARSRGLVPRDSSHRDPHPTGLADRPSDEVVEAQDPPARVTSVVVHPTRWTDDSTRWNHFLSKSEQARSHSPYAAKGRILRAV